MCEVPVISLAERVYGQAQKRKRKTTAADRQPSEAQSQRIFDFIDSSMNPPNPATGSWPNRSQWAELALSPMFIDDPSVWCSKSTSAKLQSALEKLCTKASRARDSYSNEENCWWQVSRQHLINHEKPWTWSDANTDYDRSIRAGCNKLWLSVSKIKGIHIYERVKYIVYTVNLLYQPTAH